MRKAAVLSVLLAACGPVKVSGSSAPTEHTFRLTNADLESAADPSCYQDWVGHDPEANVAEALERLHAIGVEIVERKALNFVTAFRHELRVGKRFWENPADEQAMILTHELVHYCDRERLGDASFERAYLHSSGRWRIETPAYAQEWRTAIAQGETPEMISERIAVRLLSMRNFYWLWDIDPEQYETETRRIWLEAAE
jgi:hypothetical protein